MTNTGMCQECRQNVRLEDNMIRVHKNKAGGTCAGSNYAPRLPEQDEQEKVVALARLAEIAAMPAGLDATIEFCKFYHHHPAMFNTHEFVAVMGGPHGKYILNMPEEDGVKFDLFLKEMKR